MSLDYIRDEIEKTDLRMLALLQKRIALTTEAFIEKRDLGLPLEDLDREENLIEETITIMRWPMDCQRVRTFYRNLINLCKLEAYKD